MPAIVVAGQRPGADRDALVGRVGRAVQVVDGEPQCLLCGRVAFDLDVAALPAACPGRLVLRDHAAPAELSRNAEFVPRHAGRGPDLGCRSAPRRRSARNTRPARDGISRSRTISMAERGRRQDRGRRSAATMRSPWRGPCRNAACATRRGPDRAARVSSPRSTPSNDASSVISTSPSSISNWISCSPIARSLSDTRRNVRRRMPTGCFNRQAAFGEQRAPPHVECHAMRRHIARVMHRQRPAGQQRCGPAASRRPGTSPGIGCSAPGVSNSPAT